MKNCDWSDLNSKSQAEQVNVSDPFFDIVRDNKSTESDSFFGGSGRWEFEKYLDKGMSNFSFDDGSVSLRERK